MFLILKVPTKQWLLVLLNDGAFADSQSLVYKTN